MRMYAGVAFAAILLFPALAFSKDTHTSPEPTAASIADAGTVNLERIVCKANAPAPGTRLNDELECHSVRVWNQQQRDAQDFTRHLQS